MPLTKTEKVTLGPEKPTNEFTTLPSGFRFNQAVAKAHAMEPAHTRGVVSSRGLEEGIKLPPAPWLPMSRSRLTPMDLSQISTPRSPRTRLATSCCSASMGSRFPRRNPDWPTAPPTVRSPGCKRFACISPAAAS